MDRDRLEPPTSWSRWPILSSHHCYSFFLWELSVSKIGFSPLFILPKIKNCPKGTTDPRVERFCWINISNVKWTWKVIVEEIEYTWYQGWCIISKERKKMERIMFGGYQIYMISGLVHHLKRKKKDGKDNVWGISNIHDIRVGATFLKERKEMKRILWIISGSVHHFKRKKKKERILWEISNIHDIRLGASFHAGCSYYSLPGDRKHYSGDYHRRHISMKEKSHPRCFFLIA